MARQVLENGVILPAEYSDDWYDDMTSNLTKLDDVIGSDSEKLSSADVGAAALSNNYNDLDNLPTIPTVNDATLTIQKNGVDVQTFTANASSNVTANITVPTKTSDLTNDSNFVDTSNSAVASGITSAKVTSYDSHIADTDKHVTTADKTKWNNNVTQSYVFRYSSTALTPSSTNSNTLLDNTDNLKVGDKVIDSSGVLFSITAIDTQNSTFTIGTALIDLAQDSDVVHKSGEETVGGRKTFTNIIPIDGVYLGNESSTNERTTLCLRSNRDTANKSCAYISRFRSNKTQGELSDSDTSFISISFLENENRYTRCFDFGLTDWDADGVPQTYYLTSPGNKGSLGTSSRKWQTINGIEPSSLSLPDLSNGIDISSYLNTGSSTNDSYTASVNGYISIIFSSSTACGCYVYNYTDGVFQRSNSITDSTYTNVCGVFVPILRNQTLNISSRATENIVSAKFFPCLGNI